MLAFLGTIDVRVHSKDKERERKILAFLETIDGDVMAKWQRLCDKLFHYPRIQLIAMKMT